MTVFEKYSDESLISSRAFNNYGRVVIATRQLLAREGHAILCGLHPILVGTKRPEEEKRPLKHEITDRRSLYKMCS